MAMHQITDHIWVGSLTSLSGQITMKKYHITHVLSVLDIASYGQEEERIWDTLTCNFTRLYLKVHDTEDEDIMQFFPQTNRFIDSAVRKNEGVLVHCIAGISRSVTVVCAWIMRTNKWDVARTLEYVRSKRPVANPNPSFIEQLEVYYECGYQVSLDHKPYREWKRRLQAQESDSQEASAKKVSHTPIESATWLDVLPDLCTGKNAADLLEVLVNGRSLASNVKLSRSLKSVQDAVELVLANGDTTEHIKVEESLLARVYFERLPKRHVSLRCKGCSATLGTTDSIVPHQAGPKGRCEHHFVAPMDWMRPELEKGKVDGRLVCPRCQHKLGSYRWQGSQCSCGCWLTPAFKIQKSRVDEMASKGHSTSVL